MGVRCDPPRNGYEFLNVSSAPLHLPMSSNHSLCGRPRLLLSSILPKINVFNFRSPVIRYMCPNSCRFLPITFRNRCTTIFPGGAAVRRRTRDRKVAGSTPGRGAIKSTRSTQPSITPGWVNRVPACMAGVKTGCVHLCRVEGNTV